MITCLVKPSTEENVCPKPSSHKGHAYETFVVLFVEICVELVAAATAADFVLSSSLLLASSIVNDGPATSITEDPSCGTVMRVSNADGTTVIDESVGCRGQSRGVVIG